MRDRRFAGLLMAALLSLPAGAAEPPPGEQKVAPTAFNQEGPEPKQTWGEGSGKSWWVPAADIVLFDTLLNLVNRQYFEHDYDVTWGSIKDNFDGGWLYDEDPFAINQFGHPYQGSMYHGFARSAGHGYWPAMAYTIAGSTLWEIAGETTPPSINDQFTTGFGGTFLGEPLFRLASLLLETTPGRPGRMREWAASTISPATGFNRLAFGRRFDGVFRSNAPAVYTRAQFGGNVRSDVRSDVNLQADPALPPVPQSYEEGEQMLDFTVAYGLPGKPGYTYDRPFDYFNLQLTATSESVLENMMVRGLLVGAPYGDRESYRGLWGLWGSYDFIAPQIFRVSTTSVGLGTTGQWWISRNVALQTDAIGGIGYGSGGSIDGRGERDYHNGITPQALLASRLIFGDRVLLELNAREYMITNRASDEDTGTEDIFRGDAALSIRVFGLHGITFRYVMTRREADYPELDLQDTVQRVAAINVGYTYLGHKWFGAVDWRPDARLKKLPE